MGQKSSDNQDAKKRNDDAADVAPFGRDQARWRLQNGAESNNQCYAGGLSVARRKATTDFFLPREWWHGRTALEARPDPPLETRSLDTLHDRGEKPAEHR